MNNSIKGFAEQLSKTYDELSMIRLHIKDIYAAAEDAGYNKAALSDALKEYMMTPEQLAKMRERQRAAENYKMQLKLL